MNDDRPHDGPALSTLGFNENEPEGKAETRAQRRRRERKAPKKIKRNGAGAIAAIRPAPQVELIPVDRSAVMDIIDVRGGKVVSDEADEVLHKGAGDLLLEWWLRGGSCVQNGKPFDAHKVNRVTPSGPVEADLRILLGRNCYETGHRYICQKLAVIDGRSYAQPTTSPKQLGQCLHAWCADPAAGLVTEKFTQVDGQEVELSMDVRVQLNMMLRWFELKVLIPEQRRKGIMTLGFSDTLPNI